MPAESPLLPSDAAPVPELAQGVPLSDSQFERLRDDLDSILIDPAPSDYGRPGVGRRLMARAAALDMLTLFLREARSRAGVPPGESPEAHEEAFLVFRKLRGSEAESNPAVDGSWAIPHRVALRSPRTAASPRRTALELAIREAPASPIANPPEARPRRGLAGVWNYLRAGVGAGGVVPDGFERAVAWRDLERVALAPLPEGIETELIAWVRSRPAGSEACDVRAAHRLLLLDFGRLRLGVAARAVLSGSAASLRGPISPDAAAWRAALAAARDRESAAGPLDFSPSPLLDTLMARPVFAFSMAVEGDLENRA